VRSEKAGSAGTDNKNLSKTKAAAVLCFHLLRIAVEYTNLQSLEFDSGASQDFVSFPHQHASEILRKHSYIRSSTEHKKSLI